MSVRNKDLYCIYALLNGEASWGESDMIERVSMLHIISAAYFTAGIALIIVAVQSEYVPVHVCLVGVLNIIASCGAYGKRGTLYMLILISLISLTFGFVTLAAMTFTFSQDILSILALTGTIFYVVLSITSLAYAMTQINKFT